MNKSSVKFLCTAIVLLTAGIVVADEPAASTSPAKKRVILSGTTIDPETQIRESQELAKKVAAPDSPLWKSKGNQRRTYKFPETNTDIPYRIVVPAKWDGVAKLPMVVMLHGAGGNETSYLTQSNGLLPRLAEEHGYLLVSPMGYTGMGAYGQSIRLPTVFGSSDSGAAQRAAAEADPERQKTLAYSEKDVINVVEIVANEYPVDRTQMFLMGHSMGSGGTWYLGGKYNTLWAAIAPMSGPFVEEKNYPWDRIRQMPIFITEGTGATPSLEGSRKMQEWMKKEKFKVEYKEVNADHGGMVPLVYPDIFQFFDKVRKK